MDPVCETRMGFNSLLEYDFNSSDDTNWVASAWRREDTPEFYQNGVRKRRDDDGMKSFEIYREDNPFGQADPALETFTEEGIEMAFDTMKRKASCPETRHYDAQKSLQGVGSKDSDPSAER